MFFISDMLDGAARTSRLLMPDTPAHRVAEAAREARKPDTREKLDDLARRLKEHPETASNDEVVRIAHFVLRLVDEA